MFVEVLARVRGEPSAGHSPPAAPSHSDTVTKGDPRIVLYTPPARSDTKTWPGCSQNMCISHRKANVCNNDTNQSLVRFKLF